MHDVALYGHWICPFATRVQFALAQRGVAHDLIDVPPSGVRIYYGVDPVEIDRASVALGAALDEMGLWTLEGGWLAGDMPSLAEAVAVPICVRLAGLRRLGFAALLSRATAEHQERCRGLTGWSAVEWVASQTDEFVGRFERYRAKRRGRAV